MGSMVHTAPARGRLLDKALAFLTLNKKSLTVKILLAGAVMFLLALANYNMTSAASVAPTRVSGNTSCTAQGYAFGFKVDPPNAGVYNVGSLGSITVVRPDGETLDWTSTFGIDAVLVKGGPDTNVYAYDPPAESFGDTGLVSPDHPSPGQIPGISHLEFCYDIELQVSKTATTTFDRDWDWTIEKECDETELTLAPGQTFLVDCDVAVDATSADSNYAVSGTIAVHNPHPSQSATVTGVTDVISGIGAVAVDCGVTFPHVLAAGATLNCTYSSALPDATSRVNTATATTTGTIEGGSGQADVIFGAAPTNETDECIVVDDDQFGALGSWCAADGLPHTFSYTQTVGPYTSPDECGLNEFVNTAMFTTNDTQTTGDDSHVILVDVPCVTGCSLTQGYWKTHNISFRGGAPADDTWGLLPGGLAEDTVFFGSGKTWFEVFWTPPAGNPYYQLAHQYMAAKLNVLNGATPTPAVSAAIVAAEALFNDPAYDTPAEVGALKGKNANAVKAQFTSLAGVLGSFNEGAIGPGHCDE